MIKWKIMLFWLALKSTTCTCINEKFLGFQISKGDKKISKVGILPPYIRESSGLAYLPKDNTLVTQSDGGNPPTIYLTKFPNTNFIEEKLPLLNTDWEDLATSPDGTLFIGDFGNNFNNRTNLAIYAYKNNKIETIRFSYKDQQTSNTKNFDCEAFFYFDDHLYLFSKSWEKGKKLCKIYKVPAKEGTYELDPQDSILLNFQITAADINPNLKEFVLLGYGKALFFKVENHQINFDHPSLCKKTRRKQTEAITYINEKNLILTNEQGEIYKMVTLP